MKELSVTIIIPVRNEEKYIIKCLDSIPAQDYPLENVEVLVVDGRSTDGTVDKVNEFKAQSLKLKDIKVLDNPHRVVGAGLNIGFKAAEGDIIIRMDAHAEYGRDYIRQCLAALEKSGAANVGGPALALPGGNGALARAIALAHYSPFGLGGGQFRQPEAEGFVETVWPGCFRREVFDKVGYIDERRTRTEDIEFNTRLRAAGYKIYITPLIKAYYYCRTKLRETWRQRWADGYEITHFLLDNPQAPRLRHFVPLVFVTSLLGLLLLVGISAMGVQRIANSRIYSVCLLLLALELVAYFFAMLLFVVKAGQTKFTVYNLKFKGTKKNIEDGIQNIDKNENSKFDIQNSRFSFGSLALLPLVFMTLHFSYGLGSIWGLITLPYYSLKFKAES